MKPNHVFIRFNANQIGLNIEASLDKLAWSPVEFQKWQSYASPTVAAYSSCIDPARQERDYIETLHSREIKATLVKA